MNTGIYLVYLGENNKYYVGQGNISERIQQHKSLLKHSKHYNFKLQRAFNTTNIFEYVILIDGISGKYLYDMESHYMNLFDSINSGYNICAAGIVGKGLEHSCSVYNREQIVSCMLLLLDIRNSMEIISNITGVSESTVRHISRREVHAWLDEEFPVETALLRKYSIDRVRSTKPVKPRKFNSLVSPDGTVYKNIQNITAFAREHNLNNAHIGAVLRGTRSTHVGWVGHNISRIEE